MSLIKLDDLNAGRAEAFVAALGDIYEHAPWVAEGAAVGRPYKTLVDLAAAMQEVVREAGAERQSALILAHPDLAEKAHVLTAASSAEQASAGLDRLTQDEYARFQRLNRAYKDKFGFPFIVCVRRHGKASILRQFEQRLKNDEGTEQATALSEIFRIAALRLDAKVTAPDRLPIAGQLSTHVLDTRLGRPAAGIVLELLEISEPSDRVILATVTNADGRTDAPLIHGQPIPIGTYELRFAVGAYFARQRMGLPEPAFLDVVPVRFAVAEPEGRYHVPLLVTPWSYTTYRGS